MSEKEDMDQANRLAVALIDRLVELVRNEPNSDAAALNAASSLLTSTLGRIHDGNRNAVVFGVYRVAAAVDDSPARHIDKEGKVTEIPAANPQNPAECSAMLLRRLLMVAQNFRFYPTINGVSIQFEILVSACLSMIMGLAEDAGMPFAVVEAMIVETLANGRKLYEQRATRPAVVES